VAVDCQPVVQQQNGLEQRSREPRPVAALEAQQRQLATSGDEVEAVYMECSEIGAGGFCHSTLCRQRGASA